MSDVRTKRMCKAVYLHLLEGRSLEAVGTELGLPIYEVQALIYEYRDRVLSQQRYQKSWKRVGKVHKEHRRKG